MSDLIQAGSPPKRKSWIDALRAVAMILVIYGHLVPKWIPFFIFTNPVKVTLFFAITGFVFKNRTRSERDFYCNLFRKLIVPWLVFGALPYVLLMPLKGPAFTADKLWAVISGENFWYMPCCIVAEIIWHYSTKFTKNPVQLAVCSFGLCALGLLAARTTTLLRTFTVDTALVAQMFLYIGSFYKNNAKPLIDKSRKKPLGLAVFLSVYLALGILSLYLYPDQRIDIHANEYYNLLICFVMIWIGILFLFTLADNYITRYPKWLLLVGQNTLVIYILHGYVATVCKKVFAVAGLGVNRVTAVLITVITTAVCCAVSVAVRHFLPAVFGARSQKGIAHETK